MAQNQPNTDHETYGEPDWITAQDRQADDDSRAIFRVVVAIAVVGSFALLGGFGLARVYYPPVAVAEGASE